MSGDCFWDALRYKIRYFREHRWSAAQVKAYLIAQNRKTAHVRTNTALKKSERYHAARNVERALQEEFNWRARYAATTDHHSKGGGWNLDGTGGHWTAVDDPFLALCCELFGVTIEHHWHGAQSLPPPPGSTRSGQQAVVKARAVFRHVHHGGADTERVVLYSDGGHMT
jgi:hypothetical protein